jgi:general secretion pathway protein H
LALIGLIMGMVGGSIVRNLDSVKVRRAGKDVTAALRFTRGQAIITREEQWLEVNIDKMTYKAPGKESVSLPEGVEISVKTALSDILDESTGRVRFFPDGSSTGGLVTILAGQRQWLISVAWLTGEITLQELAAEG